MVEWLRKWRVEENKVFGEAVLTLQGGVLTYKEIKIGENGKGKKK